MASLIQETGFEQRSYGRSGKQIVDRWHGEYADVIKQTAYTLGMVCPYDPLLTLNDIKISPDISRTRGIIDLTYNSADGGGDIPDTNKNIWTLSNGTLEKALETHPSYLKKWNHNLAVKNGTSKPAWFDTDNNTTDSTSGATSTYQWVKDFSEVDVSQIGKNYAKYLKIKPGIESYIVPSPVVEGTLYYSQAERCYLIAAHVGKKVTPSVTFGITGGEWLLMSASVSRENGKWKATVSCQWAQSWDSTLYPA